MYTATIILYTLIQPLNLLSNEDQPNSCLKLCTIITVQYMDFVSYTVGTLMDKISHLTVSMEEEVHEVYDRHPNTLF